MKKNFLKIAALLIAAMLLVVSCSQEVKAPENNGLVEARLNVAYGRDLSVKGATNDNLVLKYSMEYKWTDDSDEVDAVVGEKDNEDLDNSGKLGYVTPGFWTITVNAYASTDTGYDNPIFSGSASVYFNSTNRIATIYLQPASNDTYSIKFDFKMQNLGANYGTDYVVKYTISMNGSVLPDHNNEPFTGSEVVPIDNEYQSNYSKTIDGIEAGYYTVTVSVYDKDESGSLVLKGGISKGVLLAGTIPGNKVTVSGHVEPSDYIATDIQAFFVDVNTSITGEANITYLSDTATVNNKASVTLTLNDSTVINTDLGSGFSKTYVWTVDGKDDEQKTNYDDAKTRMVTYSTPGIKNISCRTIYSYTDDKGTPEDVDDDETYFWADTKSVRLVIDADKFLYN